MYYIGKFYGFLLFEENDETVRISQGSSTFKDKYKNVDEAKEQIRKWKRKHNFARKSKKAQRE